MAKITILKEFWIFLKQEKKWWLIPIIIILVLLGAFLAFCSTSPYGAFLYPLF